MPRFQLVSRTTSVRYARLVLLHPSSSRPPGRRALLESRAPHAALPSRAGCVRSACVRACRCRCRPFRYRPTDRSIGRTRAATSLPDKTTTINPARVRALIRCVLGKVTRISRCKTSCRRARKLMKCPSSTTIIRSWGTPLNPLK